jgi:phage-related protein
MREVLFYKTDSGKSPVKDFLDSLESKQIQKVTWVLQLLEELDRIPKQYFKKLENTDDIWEARIQCGNNIFRLLGYWDGSKFIVLCHGFAKKTQKVPKKEISLAEKRKRNYFRRKK